MNVFAEAAVVGAMLAPALAWAMHQFKPDTTTGVLMIGFLLGFLFHLIWEFVGLNAMYCKTGHACRNL
jgi:lipopolysaccharide export LptBFGC system permease protein LptF